MSKILINMPGKHSVTSPKPFLPQKEALHNMPPLQPYLIIKEFSQSDEMWFRNIMVIKFLYNFQFFLFCV